MAKLHYDIDEIAQTGDALVDIEVEDGTSSETTKTDDKVEVQEKDAVDVHESAVSNNKSKKGYISKEYLTFSHVSIFPPNYPLALSGSHLYLGQNFLWKNQFSIILLDKILLFHKFFLLLLR